MKKIKTTATFHIDNQSITMGFYDTDLAEEFIKNFPLNLKMESFGNREYCSNELPFVPKCNEENQTFFEVGDVAYWKKGNAFAFFYAEGISQEVPSGIVVIGKILSELSVFSDMPSVIEATLLKK